MEATGIKLNLLLISYVLASSFNLISSRAIVESDENSESSSLENDIKVYQTGTTTGFVQSNSTANAVLVASGKPAGILNAGGTTTSFTGSSTVTQDLPTNTSSSVGGSLNANCGGGQLGTFIAGQENIGLQSVSNCNSYVDPNNNPNASGWAQQ